jgi:hypothetical protein
LILDEETINVKHKCSTEKKVLKKGQSKANGQKGGRRVKIAGKQKWNLNRVVLKATWFPKDNGG